MPSPLSLGYRDQWTITVGAAPDLAAGETAIVVPPSGALGPGFAIAARLLERGSPVRLIGGGVTMPENWPHWVHASKGPLLLTELDAYQPRDRGPALIKMSRPIEAWLDRVLDGLVPAVRPSSVFWSSALERLFRWFDTWPLGHALAEAYPYGDLRCTDPHWVAFQIYRARCGRCPDAPAWRRVTGTVRRSAGHILRFAGVIPAAIGKRLWEFVTERPSRMKIASLRASRKGSEPPKVWIALHGSWARSNRPVVEFVRQLAESPEYRHEAVGVLLQASLAAGEVTSELADHARRGAALPQLDRLTQVEIAAVDQGISVESFRALLGVLSWTVLLAARALWRALWSPLHLEESGRRLPVQLPSLGLAKLVVFDVLRAREAYVAGQALLRRRRFGECNILIFAHATSVNDRVVDQLVQSTGATTIELTHGWLAGPVSPIGAPRTSTTIKTVWSISEATALQASSADQVCLAGYMPRAALEPQPPRGLEPGAPVPILIASTYLSAGWGLDPRRLEHYQTPLLEEALELTRLPFPVKLRWRPHPGDDRRRVERLYQRFPILERPSPTFEEDLSWCRILASSISSVLIEGLFAGIPVFVHDVPCLEEAILRLFDERRRFGRRHRLADLVRQLVEEPQAGHALAPEAASRVLIFGARARPHPLVDLVVAARETRAATR